jgi:hypothetical protein
VAARTTSPPPPIYSLQLLWEAGLACNRGFFKPPYIARNM